MHLLPSLRTLSSEAASGDDDRVGPVGQAIQASRGKQRIAEQLRPLLRGTVAGEQDAAALVPLVDDVVEVLGRRRTERFEVRVGTVGRPAPGAFYYGSNAPFVPI